MELPDRPNGTATTVGTVAVPTSYSQQAGKLEPSLQIADYISNILAAERLFQIFRHE